MMTLKTTLAVAAVSFLAASGLAQAETARPYISLGAGVNLLQDSDVSGGGASTEVEYNTGWALLGAAGLGVFDNFRLEAEFSHRTNSADHSVPGDISSNALMANVLYDIPFTIGIFKPYIGAGLGGARVHADGIGIGGAIGTMDDSDTVWAYQGILGMAAPLTNNLSLLVDYRFFSTFNDVDLRTSTGVNASAEYDNHTIMVGLRWSFGGAPSAPAAAPTPAAAPAPAPAPAPAAVAPLVRSFLVFFDFDKSDITEDARKIINQAADNAKKAGGTTRITLTGHADRSGPAQYNMRLSQRRADAVKAELVRLGLPAGDIATVAKGESDPLVPTADGVREPRNRRVEIVF